MLKAQVLLDYGPQYFGFLGSELRGRLGEHSACSGLVRPRNVKQTRENPLQELPRVTQGSAQHAASGRHSAIALQGESPRIPGLSAPTKKPSLCYKVNVQNRS